jgi:hypothetical protein
MNLPVRPDKAPPPPPPPGGYPQDGMTDEELRIEALEQAVQSYTRTQYASTMDILVRARDFEKYLREGK